MTASFSSDSLPVDAIRAALLDWYDAHARALPWRGTTDPYAIWISEVMSQQTRVDTVKSYYERWLATFPDVTSLAAADHDEVMALWAGLGYYRRARALHRAAREIVSEHGGELPGSAATLRKLPGIGGYTSGAIASIAFGEVVPAVDGNVGRVVSRLREIGGDPTRATHRKAIESVATQLVDRSRPGDFNQAVMELGALVCTPRNPRCCDCPIVAHCRARANDTVDEYPPRKAASPPREETRDSLVCFGAEGIVVRRRPSEGLLGGTWEVPTATSAATIENLASLYCGDVPPRFVGEVEHVFSHIRMTYRVHVGLLARELADEANVRLVAPDALDAMGMSTAMRKVVRVAIADPRDLPPR